MGSYTFPTKSQTRSLCAIDPPTDEACQGIILVHLLFEFLVQFSACSMIVIFLSICVKEGKSFCTNKGANKIHNITIIPKLKNDFMPKR